MLGVKSLVILKANPGILKRCGGIKVWMWLHLKRELYRIWKHSRNEEDRKKYCDVKKDGMRVVDVAMDQKVQELVE